MAAASKKVGIVGSGLIGSSWAIIFSSVGYEVYIYDISEELTSKALINVKNQLEEYEKSGLLRGKLTAKEQIDLIKGGTSIQKCVEGSYYIQESIPEDLNLKKKVHRQLDSLIGKDTIVGSSTSCILPSTFTEELTHRENFIVAHPVMPPYSVRLVEIVPAPWTSQSTRTKTRALMEEIGQSPVVFTKELEGFGLNRLQYVLLNECFHLVNDGVLSVQDVDKIMVEGLAPRYLWNGVLETAQLNAEGMKSYAERYSDTINRVSQTFKKPLNWSVESTSEMARQLNELIPLDDLQKAREARSARLTTAAKFKNDYLKNE